ncbi:MAG: hypothetical protein PHU85_14550 [Phycisphaerae bacterium]|nr:hypothetical protein [Phycisphaerae bacterium]
MVHPLSDALRAQMQYRASTIMAASFWLWGVGVRHYRSTGS